MNKYLPEDYPEGRAKPDDLAIGLALYGGLDDTNDTAMILAIWSKESSFQMRPTDDHGPMQLTSWVRNYSKEKGLTSLSREPMIRLQDQRALLIGINILLARYLQM